MPKKIVLVLPWIVVGILFLSLKLHWVPSYFSHLLAGIVLLWGFLGDCWEIYKNPGKKLEWFEKFNLVFFPLSSLLAFYTFCLQISH